MSEDTQSTPLDFSRIAADRFNQLTKSEKRIANYLRKNQEEAAFLSAGELAARLDLSEATLVRFARTLGFPSYPAMRSEMQKSFRQRVTHSARLRGKLDGLREAGDIFEKLVVSEIDYLTLALETINRQDLTRAAKMLQTKDRVFVFGVGPSTSLVDLLALRLGRFGKQVVPMTTAGREFLEPLMWMTSQDILITICFFDVSPALQLLLDYAHEVGCPVIVITDTLGTLIGENADVILAAKRGPMVEFHSLVVPMTVINALLLALANEDRERVIAKLDQLDHLRERLKKTNGTTV